MSGAARIGLTTTGDPADPGSWSGIPAGLRTGLAEVVDEVVAVSAALPSPADRVVTAALALVAGGGDALRRPRDALTTQHARARASPAMEAARRGRLAVVARRPGAPSLWVQYGTDVRLPARVRRVTYEDATLVQSLAAWPWPHLRGWTAAEVERQVAVGRWNYERAAAVCLATSWAARSVVTDYAVPASKVHVVGVGRNLDTSPSPERDWSVPRLLFVGRDWERKNGPRVLRVLGAVRARHPGATLDVVGDHPRLEAPGVTGHGPLRLADDRDRARAMALFAKATCLVVPSLHEPAGIVYAEAAGAGIPSLAGADGGAAGIVGDAGRVVDPRDDAGLARAALELADPATAARLGALGLVRAPRFTWRAVAERLVRALEPPGVDLAALARFL